MYSKDQHALDNLVEYVARARLVVAPDTGIRNLAISTHTPTVGIFYSTVPFRYTPIEGDHRIVMNPEGSIPSNTAILNAIQLSLTNFNKQRQEYEHFSDNGCK